MSDTRSIVRPAQIRTDAGHPDAGQFDELPRVAVITMARDEALLLPRWIGYYGGQVGTANLFVIDDNSCDGSTAALPCTVITLPAEPWKADFEQTRMRLASGLASALLACYDVVVFCDADEFLVPEPSRWPDLRRYLAERADWDVIAPVGLNVLHDAEREPPLDPSRPVLEQRRLVKFAPAMCKPDVKRIGASWRAASHGISAPYRVDPQLWLLHLKFHDLDALRRSADHRQRLHALDGRAEGTSWTMTGDELAELMSTWTSRRKGAEPSDFDVREIDLDSLVGPGRAGVYRSQRVPHLEAMRTSPLRRLPDRFRGLF